MSDPWIDELVGSAAYERWAPRRRWQAAQQEQNLLFMHYEVDQDLLRRLVPPSLELNVIDGKTWVSVIALEMTEAAVRYVPLPGAWRRFPEVDLATYVVYRKRPGLFFFSIESGNRLLAPLIRLSTGLPYHYSGLRMAKSREEFRVTCGPRYVEGAAAASLDVTYQPDIGDAEDFLDDQYSAFLIGWLGEVRELDEVHQTWRLQSAKVDVKVNTLGASIGLDLPLEPPLAHYASTRNVLSWLPARVPPNRGGLAPPI